MPFFSGWLTDGTGATTPVYSSTTLATNSSRAAVYRGRGIADWTRTSLTNTTTDAWIENSLLDQLVNATATTASAYNTVWWSDDQVDHAQYMTLAQQRATRWVALQIEETRRYDEDRLRMQAEHTRRTEERAAAVARSKELLLAHLKPQQRETFEREKFFIVEGGRTQQAYRIRDRGTYSGNIDVLEGKPGKVTHRLCCHLADHRVPLYDHLLAQKVWIESDEEAFLRQANRHAA